MWCKRHNIPYVVQNIAHGKQRIEISVDGDYYEFSAIMNDLYKVNRRNNWTIDRHFQTKTIWIYNTADYEYIKLINAQMQILVDLFYISLRDGKTQQEAKQMQYSYAVKNGMETAYNDIYA
jgi:hypothetical protein